MRDVAEDRTLVRELESPQNTCEVEPTLGALLRSMASEYPPRRALELVTLALPWAGHLASMGWWRGALAAAAIGMLGLWAICDRWSRNADSGWRRTVARFARWTTAAASAALISVLFLDLFFRLMGAGPIS